MIQPNYSVQDYQSLGESAELDSDYGILSIESQQQIQRSLSSVFGSFSSRSQRNTLSTEEYALLHQMLLENVGYPSFGFIIDKDGNIETAAGNVEQVLGMSSAQLERRSLMSFVSPMYRQKVCALLPSANANGIRKNSEIEFIFQTRTQPIKMQILSQALYSQSGNPARGRRSCVVCVARQIENTARHVGKDPAIILRLDRVKRQILNVDFNDNKFNLDVLDFVGTSIEDLCGHNDRQLLDLLLGSPRKCSGQFTLAIQGQCIPIAAFKDFSGDEIVMELSYIQDNQFDQFGDSNFNYQHDQSNIFNSHSSVANYQLQTTGSSPTLNYSNFQAIQQSRMQSNNVSLEGFNSAAVISDENSQLIMKKQRKPRKPRDPTLPKTSRGGKPTKSEKSESVPTRPDKWNLIGMGNSNANFDADSTTFCVPAVVLLTHDQTLSQSTLSDTDTPVRRRKQRKPRISNKQKQKGAAEGVERIESVGGMFNNHFPSTSNTTAHNPVASQSLSFDAGRGSSSTKMSSSQVTVTNGYPNQMAPTMYNAGASINPMQMNGIYQMNSLVPPGQASQAWQMNAPQTPTEFHPMYQQQQAQMQQMMFNQQQHAVAMTNTAQTSPTGKKANAKRKNNQQIANNVSPNQPNKQPSFSMSQGSLSANGIMPPQQHYQFPQSNPMYNNQMSQMGGVPPQMSQQQIIAQQQLMMTNGSPQFSSPTTPINQPSPYTTNNSYAQKSSEAVRIELRNTLQTRQNTNSPSFKPSAGPQPSSIMSHTVQSGVMSMPNDMNVAPNLLSPPKMPQQVNFAPMSNQQNIFGMHVLSGPTTTIHQGKSEYSFSEFNIDNKSSNPFNNHDDLMHIETPFHDFRLFSGKFNMENEETRLAVEKLLS